MNALLELAGKLQAASGPTLDLDNDIRDLAGEPRDNGMSTPRYTASLDAAMTLVPEGMRDELEITTLYQIARVSLNLNHGPDDGPYYAWNDCNSIPLALCAAALKARAGEAA